MWENNSNLKIWLLGENVLILKPLQKSFRARAHLIFTHLLKIGKKIDTGFSNF